MTNALSVQGDNMSSIKSRLAIWIISVLSVVMGLTGFLSYEAARDAEERDYLLLKQGLQERLALSLPHGVWQLDDQFIRLTLDAELKSAAVVGLMVEGDAGLFFGRMRNADGRITSLAKAAPPAHDETLLLPILYQQRNNLGQITVYLSRDKISTRLANELTRQIVQALLINLLLFIILIAGLKRYVFSPLHELQQALYGAARLEAEADLQLPKSRFSEYAELVGGVNLIIHKISRELGLRRGAEQAAIAEKERAEVAYRQLLDTQNTLVETEKLASLGSLVAGVAHEINTPVGITLTAASHLARITGQVGQQFQSGQIKKSELERYLDDARESTALILSNTERAANLIQSFKQVAVDQTSEARRQFDVAHYIGEIITSLRPKLRHSKVVIDVDCPPELQMDSYPGALSQVLTNLLMNALLHAYDDGAEGCIQIRVDAQAEQKIRLSVTDDGKGIPPENLKRIFEPFFTTRRGDGGSGLGLHIVFNIVFKRLGGTIRVDSTVGEGTSFILVLPCTAPETAN